MATLNSNLSILLIDTVLILFYVIVVLGRFNPVEQRVVLSLMGMTVIGLSMFGSFGLCFYFGFFYTDMTPIVPFLLLGLGVDNMFVMVQSLENLSESRKRLPVREKIAYAMKHAGVSITVTSATDLAAFLIGSTSVIHNTTFLISGIINQ